MFRRPDSSTLKRAALAGATAAAMTCAAAWVLEHQPVRPRGTVLSRLRDAIVGSGRTAIVRVFGPPRTFSNLGTLKSEWSSGYWQSDVWYYALNDERKIAMAIFFDGDRAQRVEFMDSPVAEALRR